MRQDVFRTAIVIVALHLLYVSYVNFGGGVFDHVHDAVGAITEIVIVGNEIGIITRFHLIVGSGNVALDWIVAVGQFIEWNVACPFVIVSPAGDREGTIAVLANRNITGR